MPLYGKALKRMEGEAGGWRKGPLESGRMSGGSWLCETEEAEEEVEEGESVVVDVPEEWF